MHVERAQCEFPPAICTSSKQTTPPPAKIGRSRVPSQIRNPLPNTVPTYLNREGKTKTP